MIINHNNEKYISVFQGIPFEARRLNGAAIVFSNGRRMGSHKFHLRPILRNPPDMERLGRAILELASLDGDQKGGEN
jgi:hypothetical protein